ncbi:eIF2A-related protein [Anabaena sp. FACHB-709]|uniref:WD-repeat containing protein n=2 Tax=Nostocaceae TaxID=1162 RepID=A0A1Z4KS02_ANAVA|nr:MULTISPECIES: AAA-like domain-containing protein [Nostocaceae]BAY71734.1 WD-repeat containing protein [Trichormus variabilis NIES-23]HBW30605.1 hypothetical protein [Nostoc sp. UBA8866]MBD2172359.1 AAA-like domain-containing protein [Anabaena cylindrica FACHB-318]MBD2263820.1 AAA-like domain-containing protein [Anabaena sp. FACHB-709]MBD2273299.1 AAA-like domain-containing protein [Nostoc sp. PCC 7120 = FACHB-418]
MVDNYEYQVGASLPPDAPSYVVRKADSDFYQALKAGKYCYVFNSRQMGKSSLKVRVMQRLVNEGVACSSIDVSGQGSKDNVTQEQWYTGIVSKIVKDLQIAKPIEFRRTWWRDRHDISPVQRFDEFIEDVLLSSIQRHIIIFVDEIDSTLSLGFASEDFFALIRSCYNKRAENPAYKRLTFALLGVATPGDLIQDKTRTPFNIGEAIELDGFKIHDIEPLAKGLAGKVENPQAVMQEVLAWTGGQPFLTQRVCELLGKALSIEKRDFRSVDENQIIELVKEIIHNQIIDNWEANDKQEHLKTIRDRLLISEEISVALLGLYQQILQQVEMTADSSFEQMRLRLTGLVVQQQGKLRVYNQIYRNVFDLSWVENELGKLRFYADKLRAWVESNYQDNTCLLWGEDLEKARVWADGRKLSDVDYRFLSASVEAELNQKVVKAETRQNQALQEEEKAKQRLTEVERKINIGGGILALFVVGAIVAAIGAISANIERQQAQVVTDLERSSADLLRLRGNVGLDNLVEAMRSVKQLKQLVKNGNQLKDYPTVSPILALHNTLEYNREINQLKDDRRVQKQVFSPDTKIVANISDDGTTKLLNLQTGTITTLKHDKKVNNVAFSPNGQIVATASDDGTAKLWNLQGGKIATFKHNKEVNDVAFSPDGKTVGTASWDTAKLWNLQGGEIATLQYDSLVQNIVFSPDGKNVAIASYDSDVKLWNLQGKEIATIIHNKMTKYLSVVNNLFFSPDGKVVATTSRRDATTKLWNLQGKEIATFKYYPDIGIKNSVFSPNGKVVAIYSDDKTVNLYNLQGNTIATLKHNDKVEDIVFSPDGNTVATVSSYVHDGTVNLWNLKGNIIGTFKHQGLFQDISRLEFSPDGQTIATALLDNTAHLWNLQGKKIAIFTHYSQVLNLAFSPDGRTITTASSDGTAKLWNLQGGNIRILKHNDQINNIVFSPDGKTVATTSYDGTAKLWNLQKGEIVTLKHDGVVNDAVFSPDGKTIATTTSSDKTVKLWNLQGQLIATLKHKYEPDKEVVFSPDSNIIATSDDTAKLWNLQGQLIATLTNEGGVREVIFNPDGKSVLTTSYENAKLWNLEGQEIATFKHKHLGEVVFSPDGHTVATASVYRDSDISGSVKLWNLKGEEIITLQHGSFSDVLFSPDGKTIATVSTLSNTAKLWNLQGREIATLTHDGWINHISFSPDGKTIGIRSGDKTVKLWNLRGQEIATLKHNSSTIVSDPIFSPDGKTIATVSLDRTVRLWTEVRDGSWQQFAEYQSRRVVFSPDNKLIAIEGNYFVQLRRVQSLDSLLARGCNDLKEYLASRPDLRKEICPDNK